MMDAQLSTPVAFFVFNRPDVTRRVFAAIAKARPTTLLLVCDGPRPSRKGEDTRVAEVRAILDAVDWPCTVQREYSSVNLGCRARVSSGLSWVFSLVDRAIILEDDCLPTPAFFRYCTALLDKYANDRRVFSISGSNFARSSAAPGHYFSKYSLMWGWATWRDRWAEYQLSPSDYRSVLLRTWKLRPLAFAYWWKIFSNLAANRIDTWDYQWLLTVWRHGALCCRPSVNLVENIGFGPDATHTRSQENRLAGMQASDIGSDFSTPIGPMVPNRTMDAVDEREWIAVLRVRSLLLMYFPWLDRLRGR